MRAVNRELVALYWEIGTAIQKKQERLGWGTAVVATLARDLLIMRRCQDVLEREFYLRATARNGWTRDVPKHQLGNKTYEKYLLSQSSFEKVLPEGLQAQLLLAVKDHYTLEFWS